MSNPMNKGEEYRILKDAGLPIPIHAVFDSSCLNNGPKMDELRNCVERILKVGSGLVGVRTEPKEKSSILGNYPHYMPLRSFDEVAQAIKKNEREHPEKQWWYLVNEAFLEYEWNAVIRLTQDGLLPGHWLLDGEVNLTDNSPLREALNNMANVTRADKWNGNDPAHIRRLILNSGLLETWLEISKVRTPGGTRLVFWGMRFRSK